MDGRTRQNLIIPSRSVVVGGGGSVDDERKVEMGPGY